MRCPSRSSVVKLLAPAVPTKIIAVGPNYKIYFRDGSPPPAQPMLWTKPASCLNDPEGTIEIPSGHTINHESELAMVIGKRAKDIDPSKAQEYIFGYTCMNDVTAGDFASPGAFAASHYFVDGKIFDTFAPLGPLIETEHRRARICIWSVGSMARCARVTQPRTFSSPPHSSSR